MLDLNWFILQFNQKGVCVMHEVSALENLAEEVALGRATPENLKLLGLSLRDGKSFQDVLDARHLRSGQQPGDFERMVAHVERNLSGIVV